MRSASLYDQQHGFQGLRHDNESGLIENRNRVLYPLTGRFMQRDPLGYPDGMNAYAAYHVMHGGVDPSGLQGQYMLDSDGNGAPSTWTSDPWAREVGRRERFRERGGGVCCDKDGNRVEYWKHSYCCENGKVVPKVSVYVVNRSGGKRTGWREGHIDMVIPGAGLVGFFGSPAGTVFDQVGMGMNGTMNNTPNEWVNGPVPRPNYIVGPGVTLPNGQQVPGVLSTICEIKVCPSAAQAMGNQVNTIDISPGEFNIAGRNCSTQGCNILAAGGITDGSIDGIDNPQNLIDTLVNSYGARCFNGYTGIDASGKAFIVEQGQAPPVSPDGTADSFLLGADDGSRAVGGAAGDATSN